jgi:hypothetical protein
MRPFAILLLLMTLTVSAAAPKKKAVATIAPNDLPHPIAQFLRSLSKDGSRPVTFRASATGTHFFFEEASGVTVYRYVNGSYVKETFLGGTKLSAAMKKYAKKAA